MSVAPSRPPFGWFLAGQASWFFTWGVQMVIFPSLLAIALNAPAATIGVAQTALMLPSLVFILLGGVMADRRDPRTILIVFHLLAAIPPVALFFVLFFERLSLAPIIVYALVMGVVTAFVLPARDSLLSRVARTDIQRAASAASGMQFISQLLGVALVTALAAFGGVAPALLVQALVMALGAVFAAPLPRKERAAGGRASFRPKDLLDGLRIVFGTPDIFPFGVTMFLVSFFFISSFLVLLPVMVRDVHYLGAASIGVLALCFWGGALVAAVYLSRKVVASPGRLYAFVHLAACGVLVGICYHESFLTLAILCFVWGLGGGVSIAVSRTIVQTRAPPESRARALSAYQLCFMGGAPLGAPLMGIIVEELGPRQAALVPAAFVGAAMVLLIAYSRVWKVGAAT